MLIRFTSVVLSDFCGASRLLLAKRAIATTSSLACDDKDRKKPSVKEEGGWFSRILGSQQAVEPQKASHSSLLSDKEVLFELTTHCVHPGRMDDFVKLYQQHAELLKKKGAGAELAGGWTVMIGNQDEAIHLYRFRDGYAGADRTNELLLADGDLKRSNNELGKLCSKRKNTYLLSFSFWGELKPRAPKHIYEMRSYILKPGTMIEWGNNWARGITYRRDFNQDVAGFFSQVGRLYMVYHFWAYEDLTARKRIREETWQKPGWDTNVAYTVPLIRRMDSRLMIPTSYSPLQ